MTINTATSPPGLLLTWISGRAAAGCQGRRKGRRCCCCRRGSCLGAGEAGRGLNNGQITQQKDWSGGEEVTYTYDSLQRLISAVTTDSPTVPQWGQSFAYDGFGNRTSATPIKGSAPYGNWSYDAATNRGGGSFDANGNMTSVANLSGLTYDVDNRLVSVPTYNQCGSGTEQYAYDASNKRI